LSNQQPKNHRLTNNKNENKSFSENFLFSMETVVFYFLKTLQLECHCLQNTFPFMWMVKMSKPFKKKNEKKKFAESEDFYAF